jgi:hypothetical protein
MTAKESEKYGIMRDGVWVDERTGEKIKLNRRPPIFFLLVITILLVVLVGFFVPVKMVYGRYEGSTYYTNTEYSSGGHKKSSTSYYLRMTYTKDKETPFLELNEAGTVEEFACNTGYWPSKLVDQLHYRVLLTPFNRVVWCGEWVASTGE